MKLQYNKNNKLKYHFIIVEHNSKIYLDEFIASIIGLIGEIKITIVNNNSDYSLEGLYNESIEIYNINENVGYGAAINKVALDSDSEFICICNSDLVFLENSFSDLKSFVDNNSNVKLFGGQQITPKGDWHYSYGDYPSISQILKNLLFLTQINTLFKKIKYKINFRVRIKKVNYLDGAFLVVENKLFKRLNGFDEDYFFYSEDADFCYRAKKIGENSYFTSNFKIIHHRGASSDLNLINENKAILFTNAYKLFLKKHYSEFYSKIVIILNRVQLTNSIFVNKLAFLLTGKLEIKSKIENIKNIKRNF